MFAVLLYGGLKMSNHSNCAVSKCTNNGRNNSEVIYHTFPKDEVVQKQWILRCKRKDIFIARTGRICSAHFLPDDYERDLKSELLGLPLKSKLRIGAVPSQNIPNWHGDCSVEGQQAKDERDRRQQKRAVLKRAMSTIEALSPKKKAKLDESALSASTSARIHLKNVEIERLHVRTPAVVADIQEKIMRSPRKSTRKLSQQAHVSRITCRRVLKSLHLKPYRVSVVQELKEGDKEKRKPLPAPPVTVKALQPVSFGETPVTAVVNGVTATTDEYSIMGSVKRECDGDSVVEYKEEVKTEIEITENNILEDNSEHATTSHDPLQSKKPEVALQPETVWLQESDMMSETDIKVECSGDPIDELKEEGGMEGWPDT